MDNQDRRGDQLVPFVHQCLLKTVWDLHYQGFLTGTPPWTTAAISIRGSADTLIGRIVVEVVVLLVVAVKVTIMVP